MKHAAVLPEWGWKKRNPLSVFRKPSNLPNIIMSNSTFKAFKKGKQNISIVNELMYQLKVLDVMTQNIWTASPDQSLRDIQHIMRDKKISGVPISKDKKLVGIISLDDIIRALDFGEIDKLVEDKMTRNVQTIEEHVSVIKAIDEMEKCGFGRLPVIDSDGFLVGIITHWDIVRKLIIMLQDVALQAEKRERSFHDHSHPAGENIDVTKSEFLVEKDDFENAGIASSTTKKQLQKRDVSPAIIRRVAVAMYETEINIIIHSLGGKMEVEFYPKSIRVTAVDEGPGIENVEKAMTEGFSTASAKIREMGFGAGMGLPNIKRCVDKFKITSEKDGQTEIVFEVAFEE